MELRRHQVRWALAVRAVEQGEVIQALRYADISARKEGHINDFAGLLIGRGYHEAAAEFLSQHEEHLRAAKLFEGLGMWRKAATEYNLLNRPVERARVLNSGGFYEDAGIVLMQQGLWEQARLAFEAGDFQETVGLMWRKQGNEQKAIAVWESLVKNYVKDQRYMDASRVLRLMGRNREGKQYAELLQKTAANREHCKDRNPRGGTCAVLSSYLRRWNEGGF